MTPYPLRSFPLFHQRTEYIRMPPSDAVNVRCGFHAAAGRCDPLNADSALKYGKSTIKYCFFNIDRSPAMNIEQARFNMIEQQIRTWDVLDQDVLDLLTVVKREEFVPAAYRAMAFMDTEIPLPCGQNMLVPKLEARLLQEAAVRKHENVLEIGAGSGYMAALLAAKARHVTTVEIEPELKALAERNLAACGASNVSVVLGDGAQGWSGSGHDAAPYDVIMISGSLPVLPDAFLQQIKVGGRIIAVIGTAPVMSAELVTRVSEVGYVTTKLFETSVKPLRNALTPPRFRF
jgi:protein-L-isoaspartate(D-aspartate) O-methyltransferase